ncbi:tyrosine-type recombinase/integrase [Paeniglutamicibacter gangotriensis]|uniref:Tyrosine recombinase XerC n=1 Tax=Paeniglutamicibacter gangotriensis Lz1y TaxID=1276920 RepID=M7NN84_9MICC|nr:tyrosine-type recombinase/integrase [Paeniglutamicibacter gangotriensis]EMQ99993.1 tyrosine recombinase XerC [Paeniglutamicibacter gangotriensis Lz1y]
MTALAPILEAFFAKRLMGQQRASANTVASYRDAFRLFLRYAHETLGKAPQELDLEDLDARIIGGFLAWLENSRGCSIQTRNARLAAIRALFRYASFEYPEHAELIQRVLAIPAKRTEKAIVAYLTETETNALINAPTTATWRGRRDKVLLLVAVVTGLRVSELVNLTVADVELGPSSHLLVHGKGRKDRITPLSAQARRHLTAWFKEQNPSQPDPVFPGTKGNRLTRDGVAKILARHVVEASTTCPSLAVKNISPHTLRHTCAMRLLQSGVDIATIALWLGHENIRTSGIYLHADLALKQRALDRTRPPDAKAGRYRAPDTLLAFLEGL